MDSKAKVEMMFEEWNGTASTKLTKTAIITFAENRASSSSSSSSPSSSASIQKSSSPFGHITRRVLEAFVPEAGYNLFTSRGINT